jgi:hypothetical protein
MLPANHTSIITREQYVKLEGTLATFPLRELIDMICYSSVTGALNIYADVGSGHLFFRDGHLYHGDYCGAIGIDSLAGMMELDEAKFSFVSDAVSEQETLWGDIGYHLQTAERLATRWRQVRLYIQSLALVPRRLVTIEAALRRVGPSFHEVLQAIDGQRSLSAIAGELSWSTIDTAEAIAQMSQDGLVELLSSPQPDCGSGSGEPQRAGGLFERLRMRGGAPASDSEARPAGEPPRPLAEELVLRALRS